MMEKENGKYRMCLDFRRVNRGTNNLLKCMYIYYLLLLFIYLLYIYILYIYLIFIIIYLLLYKVQVLLSTILIHITYIVDRRTINAREKL